jgi:colicin import membrane protein
MANIALRRPPSADARSTGMAMALGAHGLLFLALAIGVSWRTSDPTPISAELWSAVPQIAAPAPPPPPAQRAEPKPVVKPAPPPAPPKAEPREADIAVEKKPVPKPKPEPPKAEEKPKEKVPEKPDPKLEQQKALEEKRKLEDARKKAEQEESAAQARIEKQREENLRRMTAQAGGPSSDTPDSGSAAKSAGPSADYAGRVRARVLPNITYTEPITGSKVAEVEVRVAPDGRILSRRLVKPSGVPDWDEAVLRAIDKTEQFPRDRDGTVPSSMIIKFDSQQR